MLRLDHRATYADYLAVEQSSQHRHELIDGVIVAMAGGLDEHNAIAGRLAMLFGVRLEGPCRYFSPDQRFWIPSSARSRYSDGSIVCGKPEHPPHDEQATTNPVVAVEVLSPTSEGDDEGDKRTDFQSLATLKAYFLVSQDQRSVRVYRRDPGGAWLPEPEVYRRHGSISLPLLTAPFTVEEVYDNILDERDRSLLR